MQPALSRDRGLDRAQVRHAGQHHAAGPQPRADSAKRLGRLIEVLEHVPEHHGVEARGRVLLDARARYRSPGRGGRVRSAGRGLDARRREAGPPKCRDQAPAAGAGVEDTPARRHAGCAQQPRRLGVEEALQRLQRRGAPWRARGVDARLVCLGPRRDPAGDGAGARGTAREGEPA